MRPFMFRNRRKETQRQSGGDARATSTCVTLAEQDLALDNEDMLDAEIRRAMQAEYGDIEPPGHTFERLARRIRTRARRDAAKAHKAPTTLAARTLVAVRTALKEATNGLAVRRLAPAAVAVVLALVLTGPSTRQIIGSLFPHEPLYRVGQITPVAEATADSQAAIVEDTIPIQRYAPYTPLFTSAEVQDPVQGANHRQQPAKGIMDEPPNQPGEQQLREYGPY